MKDFIILGSTGLVGTALCECLKAKGFSVIEINSSTYEQNINHEARILVNCNGSNYRFRAAENPKDDFDVNVRSVKDSLFDFKYELYIYCSTIDVYPEISSSSSTREDAHIESSRLHPYGFHKWLSERIVEKYARNYVILRLGTVIGRKLKKGPIYDIVNNSRLFLSPESILSFLHTNHLNAVIEELSKTINQREIINVTGNGEVLLQEVINKHNPEFVLPDEECQKTVYSISTEKISARMKLPSSEEMVAEYFSEL